jgi:Na+/melibiose symporter-like transporter
LAGAVPYALAYFALWQVPPWAEDGDTIAILWYLLVIFAYNTTFTCVAVPYR